MCFWLTGLARPRPWLLRSATSHVIQAPIGDVRLLSVKDVLARFRKLALSLQQN